MADLKKYEKDAELWEKRKLGASAKHAVQASDEQVKALDNALGLQLLSFRIQKSLIQKLKNIAKQEGIGYQPLMRQVLTRYVREKEQETAISKAKLSKKRNET